MSEEKEYTFKETVPGQEEPKVTVVKESQLNKRQMDLLFEELNRTWGNMPVYVKTKFLYMLQEALPSDTKRAEFLKKALDEDIEKMAKT